MGRITEGAARVRAGAAGLVTVSAVQGIATEAAADVVHLLRYPFHTSTGRSSSTRLIRADGRPADRALALHDVHAAGTPILLLHGIFDNRSVFSVLRPALHRRGFGRIETINYPVLSSDVRATAVALGQHVADLVGRTGYPQVHIIGHSLGGLIARYYVQRLGGDQHVHTLITLGTPHEGTVVAHLLPALTARQLRPGSAVMHELAEPAPGCRTRFVAFWTDIDPVIRPVESAQIRHADLDATNILVRGTGHNALPFRRAVVREISATLAVLDRHGRTLAPAARRYAELAGAG